MPFFDLPIDEISFPPCHFADIDGLLAIGGNVTAEWLLKAYQGGIYLWSSPIESYHWWAPDPRLVIMENDLFFNENIFQIIQDQKLEVRFNSSLQNILKGCEDEFNIGEMNRKWILGSFVAAYIQLEKIANVQTCEIWKGNNIIGGVFGTVVKQLFLGEYVFGINDSIKEIALIKLIQKLSQNDICLFDVTKETMETNDIGIKEISRNEFFGYLQSN